MYNIQGLYIYIYIYIYIYTRFFYLGDGGNPPTRRKFAHSHPPPPFPQPSFYSLPTKSQSFHSSMVDQMNTRNFWELSVINCLLKEALALRQLNSIHKKGP